MPNFKIQFVGRRLGLKPLHTFTDGNTKIPLPMNQTRAFAHPQAKAILQHAPDLYKKVVPKSKVKK